MLRQDQCYVYKQFWPISPVRMVLDEQLPEQINTNQYNSLNADGNTTILDVI